MDALTFLSEMAILQSRKGSHVSVGELAKETKFSRQYCHKHMNALIARNFARRIGHGKYLVSDNVATLAIGLTVLTAMDVYEHQVHLQLKSFSESA